MHCESFDNGVGEVAGDEGSNTGSLCMVHVV